MAKVAPAAGGEDSDLILRTLEPRRAPFREDWMRQAVGMRSQLPGSTDLRGLKQ